MQQRVNEEPRMYHPARILLQEIPPGQPEPEVPPGQPEEIPAEPVPVEVPDETPVEIPADSPPEFRDADL